MMPEDSKPFTMPPSPGPSPAPKGSDPRAITRGPDALGETETPAVGPVLSPAQDRFRTCRWRAQPDEGSYCTHRDVLPLAGKVGFTAEAWCPDCQFYKVRRAPRRRTDY
jgi:hypothetical protein